MNKVISIKNFLLTLSSCFLIFGCSPRNISKDFDNNLDKFNDFYGANRDTTKTLVYPAARLEEELCIRKDVKISNITLKDLVSILRKSYDVNINYTEQPSENKKIETKLKSSKSKREIAEEKKGDISFSMNKVCLTEVLDALVENYNVLVKKTSYGYVVSPKQITTETFVVNYHNFYRKGSSSISIKDTQLKEEDGTSGSHSSLTSSSEETFWVSIENTIRTLLNGRSGIGKSSSDQAQEGVTSERSAAENFYIYKESGLIVVTAYPRELKNIRDFLSKVNGSSVKQVLIEAKVLEIELLDQFSSGLQWDVLKESLRYSSFTKVGQPFADIDLLEKISIPISDISDQIQPGRISAKGLNPTGFSFITQALSSQGNISLVSSVRVSSLNNQRALIKAGTERYFVTNVSSQTQPATVAGGAPTTQSSFSIEPFFSGVSLDVTPHILENNQVLLHIHPMISRVEKDKFQATVDGKVTELPAAKIDSRESDNVVRSFSGDIIILGGMGDDLVQDMKAGLPFKDTNNNLLDKIKDVFASKNYKNRKRELIILIRPTIIDSFEGFEKEGTFDINDTFVKNP